MDEDKATADRVKEAASFLFAGTTEYCSRFESGLDITDTSMYVQLAYSSLNDRAMEVPLSMDPVTDKTGYTSGIRGSSNTSMAGYYASLPTYSQDGKLEVHAAMLHRTNLSTIIDLGSPRTTTVETVVLESIEAS